MEKITIRVKNYRCFSDASPAEIVIQRGFVAFVGANNSGKSSLLKMIHELQHLWHHFAGQQKINPKLFAGPRQIAVNLRDIYDVTEIFNDRNERDITIEVEVEVNPRDLNAQEYIRLIRFTLPRNSQQQWSYQVFLSDGKTERTTSGISYTDQYIVTGNGLHITPIPMHLAIEILYKSLYIGPFRNAINDGATDYYSLRTGSGFIDTWHDWKTGQSKERNIRLEQVTDDIRRMFRFEQLEINASPGLKTLSLSINRRPYKLRELGAGLSHFIIVLGNAAILRPSLVLIDEPEIGLHPSLQIDFLTSLTSYATFGVIYATHSIGLARSTADRIYSFRLKDYQSRVRPFELTTNYLEFIGEMSYSGFAEMGCKSILAVEGVTEIKTVQQWLRKMKKDHEVMLLPLGGSQMINAKMAQELAELKRLTNNISVLIDSEKTSETSPIETNRLQFIKICLDLDIKVHATNLRATENYFPDRAIKNVKGPSYRQLGAYEKLSDCEPKWSKSENWKIALEMTTSELDATDIGKFLRAIDSEAT